VLEVGSGAVGLACLYPFSFVGCDLRFDRRPQPKMRAVAGSATQLPFPDRSFPVVVCLDVFEHIQPRRRTAFLQELLRVARARVILAFPSGDAAHRTDARLASYWRLRRLPDPDWLLEHQQWPLPSAWELETQLDLLSLPYRRQDNSVWPLHLLVMVLDSTRLGPALARLVTRHPRPLLPLLQLLDHSRAPGGAPRPYRLVYWIDKKDAR
jgi:hypothetical protein